MHHALLIAEVLSMPWAVEESRVAIFTAVLARVAAGRATDPQVMAAIEADVVTRGQRRDAAAARAGGGAIAVLLLHGILTPRGNMVDAVSGPGTTSLQMFTQALRSALADDTVGGILIDIDSPGGAVQGTMELADEIYRARAEKPIYALANNLAASAAYWIAASASQAFVTPSGEVGSIGVYTAHKDMSKALELEGISTTLVSAGKFKTEGSPYAPLSPEARAAMQERVDSYYQAFVKSVARGRGVPVAQVREGMGQGRVVGARQAFAEKMIDSVATFDQAVTLLSHAIQIGSSPGARAIAASDLQARARLAHRQRELQIAGLVKA